MLLVEMDLVAVKSVNLLVRKVESLLEEMIQYQVDLDIMLSAKNLEKANEAVRSLINPQNVVNPRNLKVNVNDRGIYGKEIKSIPYC